MSDDFWVIQWHDHEAGANGTVTETAESPEEVVEVLRRLLSGPAHGGTFEELFRGAPPELLLRHVRGVVEYGARAGTLILTRTRSRYSPLPPGRR
jgi:hypothetical protein